MSRPSDELAAEVDHVPCPTCHAEVGEPCVNPLKQSPARVPCIQRIKAAAIEQDTPGNAVICHEEARNQ